MRILQLLSSSGYHGSESMTAELTRQLHALGVTVDIGVFDNAGRGDRHVLDVAAPFIREGFVLPCAGALDRSTVSSLRRYVIDKQIDVVHSHKYKTTFYALLASRGIPCPVVSTYHNWLGTTPALRAYALLDKMLSRFCDAAVGVSHPVTDELRRYAPVDRVHYIGNGIDIDIYRRAMTAPIAKVALGLPVDAPIIGFVGRLSAQKGISFLLRALAMNDTDIGRQAHLVIVGDGEERSALTDEARALGVAARTHFLGTRNDTPPIYAALDVFVLPSEQEAFPMVILEAMACEVPVIGTDIGDVARIIENGTTGYVVNPRNVEQLHDALNKILRDLPSAQKMGRAGRERVSQKFSSRQMAVNYLDLYRQLMPAGTAR